MGRGTIELIERGQTDPSVETCVLIAQALGTSAAALLNDVAELSQTTGVKIDADTIGAIENGKADTLVRTLNRSRACNGRDLATPSTTV